MLDANELKDIVDNAVSEMRNNICSDENMDTLEKVIYDLCKLGYSEINVKFEVHNFLPDLYDPNINPDYKENFISIGENIITIYLSSVLYTPMKLHLHELRDFHIDHLFGYGLKVIPLTDNSYRINID